MGQNKKQEMRDCESCPISLKRKEHGLGAIARRFCAGQAGLQWLMFLSRVLVCAALVLPLTAQASLGAAEISAYSQQWIDELLQRHPLEAEAPLRLEVKVGKLDPRLRLAPCQHIQPWLPIGTRLWGHTRIGLRCAEANARWTVFVPLTIHALGMAWVLTGDLAAGTILTEQHARLAEVDWAAQRAPIVVRREDWLGQSAARHLPAGQALRRNMLRPVQVFRRAASVRISVQGEGYSITASGKALGAGNIGQSVRVRLDNGRVVVGTVGTDGVVNVSG